MMPAEKAHKESSEFRSMAPEQVFPPQLFDLFQWIQLVCQVYSKSQIEYGRSRNLESAFAAPWFDRDRTGVPLEVDLTS